MLDFTQLEQKVSALVALVAKVKQDYADMIKLIDELKAEVAGTPFQIKVDELSNKVSAALADLTIAEDSFPTIPAPEIPVE